MAGYSEGVKCFGKNLVGWEVVSEAVLWGNRAKFEGSLCKLRQRGVLDIVVGNVLLFDVWQQPN